MKKLSLVVMLLCVALVANAQLLWKVSGKDLSKPSYVFGTHHLAPVSIVKDVAGFHQAMDAVEQVYGEIVVSEMNSPESMKKVQHAIVLPGDTTLHTLFNDAEYDSIAVHVKELMGADLNVLDRMKPAFINSQLSLLLAMRTIEGFNPQLQLDGWVQAEAMTKGKKVDGLENVDFQMGILFDSQTLQRQSEQLYCSVTHLKELAQQSQRMTTAYMNQKLGDLSVIMDEKMGNACDALPEEEETLIYGRNANWVGVMPAIMKEAPTMFVVGVGHLLGERGILSLLKKQGYTVEAVK